MTRRGQVFWMVFFSLIPARTGYAAPSVALKHLELERGKLSGLVNVQSAGRARPVLSSLTHGTDLRTQSEIAPVDFWLLFDSSALCAKYQMDQTALAWLSTLKSELPAASRLSVVSYHRGSLELLLARQPVGEAKSIRLRCDSRAVSAEPDKALAHFLAAETTPELPRVIWIASSGNASISATTLQKLKASGAELSFLLYHASLAATLQPVFERFRASLGPAFRAEVIAPQATELPARLYRISAIAPEAMTMSFVVKVPVGDQVIKSGAVTLSGKAPGDNRILYGTLIALLALGLLFTGIQTIRYFLPRYCRDCGHRKRFGDATCPFCFAANGAYLVQENPLGAEGPVTRPLVKAVDRAVISIGSHRRSALRCLRSPKERRQKYFALHREGETYRLVPAALPVTVNGVPVRRERMIGTGDEIQVAQTRIRFLQNGVNK